MRRSLTVMSWTKTVFPEFDWSSVQMTAGAFHRVLIGPETVARIVRGTAHRERAARETRILIALSGLDLGVHVPDLVGSERTFEDWTGYVVTRVPGEPSESRPWADVREVLEDVLARFAAVTVPAGLPPARSWCGGDRFAAIVEERLAPLLGPHGDLVRHVVADLEALPSGPRVLVHGDFGPHNLLWDAGRPVSLIDLDHACVNDQAMDVATLIGRYGADQVGDIVSDALLSRGMVHRATLPLQVAAAGELAGRASLRDHGLANFAARAEAGTLYDPGGRLPS